MTRIENYDVCSVCKKVIDLCIKEHVTIFHNGKHHHVHDNGYRWDASNCSYKLREQIRRQDNGNACLQL